MCHILRSIQASKRRPFRKSSSVSLTRIPLLWQVGLDEQGMHHVTPNAMWPELLRDGSAQPVAQSAL